MGESYVNDWLTVCSPDTLIVGEVLIVSLTHHQLKQSAWHTAQIHVWQTFEKTDKLEKVIKYKNTIQLKFTCKNSISPFPRRIFPCDTQVT